jgi:peptidoglycan/LPS O-acetylase OafA/YrhL
MGLAWAGLSSPVSVSALTVILTLLLANDLWWVSAWGFLPGAWSISAEAVHYLIFPVVRRWSARRLMFLAVAFALASTLVGVYAYWVTGGDYTGDAGQFWTWINTLAPWNTIAYFLAGVAIAVGPSWTQRRLGGGPRLGLGLVILVVAAFTVFAGSLTILVLMATAAAFVLLADAQREPGVIVQWVGRRSYGTYFTHFVVLLALSKALEGAIWDAPPLLSVAALIVSVVVVLGVSSALSQVLWILLERKAINWSRGEGIPRH